MDSVIKPVDLYDIARMCVQAYRSRPHVSGWQAVHPSDMRLSEAKLADMPYVNRTAAAFWRPPFETRRAMMVVVVRGDRAASESLARGAQEAVAGIRTVLQHALGWADRGAVREVVVAAHGFGADLAAMACEGLRAAAGGRLLLVAFGADPTGRSGVPRIDVLRYPPDAEAMADEYLYDIRALYETGDLAEMMRNDGRHTVIRIPAAARQ